MMRSTARPQYPPRDISRIYTDMFDYKRSLRGQRHFLLSFPPWLAPSTPSLFTAPLSSYMLNNDHAALSQSCSPHPKSPGTLYSTCTRRPRLCLFQNVYATTTVASCSWIASRQCEYRIVHCVVLCTNQDTAHSGIIGSHPSFVCRQNSVTRSTNMSSSRTQFAPPVTTGIGPIGHIRGHS
jgi:hypothetical protein